MENVSQVVLRNAGRLPPGPLLLLNPPRDNLAAQLRRAGRATSCWTQDHGDYRWLQSSGEQVAYSVVPEIPADQAAAILVLPREKERLAFLAHAIADRSPPGLRLWLVGENRSGIRSAGRHLQAFFRSVQLLDKARHCALIEASGSADGGAFAIEAYRVDWQLEYAGHAVKLCSLPGVFAHGRLDGGTRLLLQACEGLSPRGRILDFACGCGVLGVALKLADPTVQLTLLDASATALEAARLSLAANGLAADLLPSSGLAEVEGRFDWIVSNPPFHRGVDNDLDVAAEFFRCAGTFLLENGRMVVVFNRHLPYFAWLRRVFVQVERIVEDGEFTIVLASQPR